MPRVTRTAELLEDLAEHHRLTFMSFRSRQ